jgi:adenosyl cobinamide kinase/adenosyl cobinamide phosphate guanylyltransferase
MPFVLLLGGARSGKSALAVRIASRSAAPVAMIATAEAGDPEMADRIARHRAQRPQSWTTVEEPTALVEAVGSAPVGQFLIVDCLTLWVSNRMARGDDDGSISGSARAAAEVLAGRRPGAVVVSNEVGLGIVPENALARRFRDTLGVVNTTFAAAADRSLLLAAGRILELRPEARLLEDLDWP